MGGYVCPICGREVLMVYQCEKCGRNVCSNCIRNPGAQPGQVCKTCDLKLAEKIIPSKALSGYAEYFYCMALNWKPVENRNWSMFRYIEQKDLPFRIILHASKTPASEKDMDFILQTLTYSQYEEFARVDWSKYRGKAFAEITITEEIVKGQFPPASDKAKRAYNSKWFFGKYGFVVQDGELYEHPVPCRGALGFFPVTLQGARM